jgi:hypothetical protein
MKEIKDTLGHKRDYILIASLILFSALILFKDLDKNTPLYYDEALYSAKDVEFMKDGQNLFFPKGDLQAFYNIKPPLKTWMKYPLYKAFGINTFTIRFLDAMMGLATIFLIFLIGKNLLDCWAGFSAGFIFITFKGLLTDYWARVNGYDSGAVLGTVAFFYFFIFHREKKLGWLWCGLSLAFITYFKHISAILPFAAAALYLLVDKGLSGLLNKRFFLMTAVWLLPVFAFYIPYAIHNKTFLGHFFGYEVFTVVTEGTGKHGRGDPFYYIKWLSRDAGYWFPLVIASLIASIFLAFKRKLKILLPVILWFLLPFIALSIAATRINRYMFPSYPALALLTGYVISSAYMFLLKPNRSGGTKRKPFITLALFSFLFIIIFANAGIVAFKATRPFYRENYHRLSDFYRSGNAGSFYLTEGNMKRYGWAERVIIHSMGNRLKVITGDQTESQLVKNLGRNDAIALYNHEIFELFYTNENISIPAEKFVLVDFALDDSFYSKHKLFRKVILFLKDSPIVEYFKAENITPFNLLSMKMFESLSEKDFIAYISRLSFGIASMKDSAVQYYSGKIRTGDYTRRELTDLFGCYSKWFTSKEISGLIEKEVKSDNLPAYYPFADFYSPRQTGSIYLVGLKFLNFTPAAKCQILRTRNRWIFKQRNSDINALLQKISGDDAVLMRRADLIRWLDNNKSLEKVRKIEAMPDNRSKISESSQNPESAYSFFSLKKRSGYLRPQTKYFNITGCVKTGGNLYNFLLSKKVELLPLMHPMQLMNWKEPSDSEFIEQAISVIFDCSAEPKFKNLYLERLEKRIVSRSELFEIFLKQARELEY